MKEIDKLNFRPFTRFCMSIGAVPSSYLAGLTIEEQLLWFCSYLEKEVIPAINNNAEATEELQTLFTELHNYVEHYFDNLDVQEEINNKLDDMAEDGTLDNIINQQIFGEINDEIATINNTTIPALEDEIDTLKRNALYIGNSYISGVGSTDGETGIFKLTKDMFNHAYQKTLSGIGWLSYTEHSDTFLTCLSNAISDTNIPNDEITDLIVVGAWGDTRAVNESGSNFMSTYSTNLQNAIISFKQTAEANFPNLKRISFTFAEGREMKDFTQTYTTYFSDAFWFHNRAVNLFPKNGIEYLGWIGFNILLDTNMYSSDHYHPNNAGYKQLSTLFKSAYQSNFTYKPINLSFSNSACGITSGSKISGRASILPERTFLNLSSITLASGTTPSHGTEFSFLDFNNVSKFSIPYPTGSGSSFELGMCLDCTTQHPSTDATFNRNNDFLGRLFLVKSTSNPNSVEIRCQANGTAKTISTNNLNSVHTPLSIEYDNSYYQS